MDLAPTILFAYNRPEHTKKTLTALANNDLANFTHLIVYCDASHNDCPKNKALVKSTRKVVVETEWPGTIDIIERKQNIGLAKSIIDGVTECVSKFGKVIILEDDLITGKGFLTFMNSALNKYQDEDKVMHISGHMHPFSFRLPKNMFYQVTNSWGWATWNNSWSRFINDADLLMNKLMERNLIYRFNLDGAYDFFRDLKLNSEGKLDTWAVKWYATVFLDGGLSLYPGRSLVRNIGHDASGVHCGINERYQYQQLADYVELKNISIRESKLMFNLMKEYYQKKGAVSRINKARYYLFDKLDYIKKIFLSNDRY